MASFHDLLMAFDERVKSVSPLLYLTRDRGLQQDAVNDLSGYHYQIDDMRQQAIRFQDEENANIFLGMKCVVAGLISELKVYINLKNDNMDEAWSHLISAQSSINAAMRANAGFSTLSSQSHRLRELEKYLFPPQQFLSAGLIVGFQQCSICNDDYSKCDHLAGKAYMGRFCAITLKDVEPNHVAFVDEPANRHCRVTATSVSEGRRNVMTWRVSEPDNPTPSIEGMDDPAIMESVIATNSDFEGEVPEGPPASMPN